MRDFGDRGEEKMKPYEPTDFEEMAFGEEISTAFFLSFAAFIILLFGGLIYAHFNSLDLNGPPTWQGMGIIIGIPLGVFIVAAIFFKWWGKKYYFKNNNYYLNTVLLELNDKGQVINHTFKKLLPKTLTCPCAYATADLSFYWPDESWPYRDDYLQTISHGFEIMINESFGLKLKITLELEMTAEFNPQEIYELLAKPGIDMQQYFLGILNQSIQKEIEFPLPTAIEYHAGEITEAQFAERFLGVIKIKHGFSNLKVKQVEFAKPLRFVLH